MAPQKFPWAQETPTERSTTAFGTMRGQEPETAPVSSPKFKDVDERMPQTNLRTQLAYDSRLKTLRRTTTITKRNRKNYQTSLTLHSVYEFGFLVGVEA